MDVDLVSGHSHGLVIIPHRQLAKRRQSGSPHPNHEAFVLGEIGDIVVLGIAKRVPDAPVGRRHDLVTGVGRLLEELLITVPRNSLCCHVVIITLSTGGVQTLRRVEGIVEFRVRNQTARIIRLSGSRIQLQRIAVAAVDGRVAAEIALHLRRILGLNISTVVLVEVGEAVVHEDGRADFVLNFELDGADGLVVGVVRIVGPLQEAVGPSRSICARVVDLEMA